jgi:polar amino acid transport system substrate-binding protein
MTLNFLKLASAAAIATIIAAAPALAGPLQDRIDAGEPIRIGFSNIPNFGFPGADGNAEGFMNDIAVNTLKSMGYTNIETVVTEWGGLIPGLQAGRYDLITGGLYITGARCENIAFSEPAGAFGDAFLVEAGNPKNINTYDDILNSEYVLTLGAGYNTVEAARKVGIPDAQLMQVPGPTEMFAALNAGRADAAVLTYFEADSLVQASEGKLELGDAAQLPEWTKNWAGMGFRSDDSDFVADYNAAQAAYLGSAEMLETVAVHGYTDVHLPGDVTMDWACENR